MVKNSSFGKLMQKRCTELYSHANTGMTSNRQCEATHDSILCWAPTPAGETVSQNCPPLRGFYPLNFAYRHCGHDGTWKSWNNSVFMIDKTDFQECLVKNDPTKHQKSVDVYNEVIETAKITNIIGISLLVAALLSVSVALFIYYVILPKFVNNILHVRIHKHLYIAIILDAVVELISQIMVLIQLQTVTTSLLSMSKLKFVCETLTALGQYAELAILFWMTIDAHFIQITARTGQLCTSGFLTYCVVGWGVPVVPTSIWVVTLIVSHKVKCWSGYSTLPIIWVMEIPKLISLMTTVILLCLAIWRLHVNIRKGKNLYVEKIRNEVIMAGLFFVFILMSILFSIIPTHAHIGDFVIWQYLATIMTSSRGIFLSVFYTFLNKDVHNFIKDRRTRLPLKSECH